MEIRQTSNNYYSRLKEAKKLSVYIKERWQEASPHFLQKVLGTVATSTSEDMSTNKGKNRR